MEEEKSDKKPNAGLSWWMIGLVLSLFINGIFGILYYSEYRHNVDSAISHQQIQEEYEEELNLNQERMDELSQSIVLLQSDVFLLTQQLNANNATPQNGKVAYLTFDDGPTEMTPKILDVLKEYDVKATFFVLGSKVRYNPQFAKRIVDEGHSIGNHSNTHRYDVLYSSFENLKAEIDACNAQVKAATGVDMTAFRFPGGSSNTMFQRYSPDVAVEAWLMYVHSLGMEYFDWNVSSLDASSALVTSEVIVESVIRGAGNKKQITVLMHDVNKNQATLDALPMIIERLREKGYSFEAITSNTIPVQHKIAS